MATRCVISATEWSRRARYKTNNDKQTGVHALALTRRVNTAARFGARTPPRPASVALGRSRREIAASLSLSLPPSRALAFSFRVLHEDTARFRKNEPAADFSPFVARNHVPRGPSSSLSPFLFPLILGCELSSNKIYESRTIYVSIYSALIDSYFLRNTS